MCDCFSLKPSLLLYEFSGVGLRNGGHSRCYVRARSRRGFIWGRGSEVVRSKPSGWRSQVHAEGFREIREDVVFTDHTDWMAGKDVIFSGLPDVLHCGCFAVKRGGRNSACVGRSSSDYQPEMYDSLKEVVFSGVGDGQGVENAHLGPARMPQENGDKSASDTSAPSGYDVLELKREVEKEERKTRDPDRLEDENCHIYSEEFAGLVSDSEDENKVDQILGSRSGRQMLRRSSLIAKQVISVQSARSLGFISELWVDTLLWIVVVVEVRPNLLSGEMEKLLLEDVHQVGDVVLVQDESVMENELKMIGLDTLVGYNVMTSGRRNIGKVRGYNFNINSGAVESLELDSFGMSIIPSSLVSTYCLMVEDVIEVVSDTVVVHEGAASRLQRLTKGFWDAPKSEASWDDIEDFSDFRRRSNRSGHRRRHGRAFSSRKFPDDWDLPMDF